MQSYFEMCDLRFSLFGLKDLVLFWVGFFVGLSLFYFFVCFDVCLFVLLLISCSIWCSSIKWISVKIYLITQAWSLRRVFPCSSNTLLVPQPSVPFHCCFLLPPVPWDSHISSRFVLVSASCWAAEKLIIFDLPGGGSLQLPQRCFFISQREVLSGRRVL